MKSYHILSNSESQLVICVLPFVLSATLTSLAASLSFSRFNGPIRVSGIVRERERPIGLTKMELYLLLAMGEGSGEGMCLTTVGVGLPASGEMVDKESGVLVVAGFEAMGRSFELCGGVEASCIAEVGRVKHWRGGRPLLTHGRTVYR